MTSTPYDARFFSDLEHTSSASAQVVVPILVRLVRPNSVLDVGCGHGVWLHTFQDYGVKRVRGLDGDYIDRSRLLIAHESFTAVDLRSPSFQIAERYDLALCLEVAEHLPARDGDRLVQILTETAPVIVFSAAIPGQGGVNHVNEQWPDYWSKAFHHRGFRMIDALRPAIRDNAKVAWYYRQNMLVYVAEQAVLDNPAWVCERDNGPASDIEWVHISVLHNYRDPKNWWRLSKQRLRRIIQRRLFRVGL